MSITRDELYQAEQNGQISMQFAARVRGLIGLYREATEGIDRLLDTRAKLASMVNSMALEVLECEDISSNVRDQANEYIDAVLPYLDPTRNEDTAAGELR